MKIKKKKRRINVTMTSTDTKDQTTTTATEMDMTEHREEARYHTRILQHRTQTMRTMPTQITEAREKMD
eukprot:9859893-Prorocentrum_lima.AAC.1